MTVITVDDFIDQMDARDTSISVTQGDRFGWFKKNAPAFVVGGAVSMASRTAVQFGLAKLGVTTVVAAGAAVPTLTAVGMIAGLAVTGAIAGGITKVVTTHLFHKEKQEDPHWMRKAFVTGALWGAVGGTAVGSLGEMIRADGVLHDTQIGTIVRERLNPILGYAKEIFAKIPSILTKLSPISDAGANADVLPSENPVRMRSILDGTAPPKIIVLSENSPIQASLLQQRDALSQLPKHLRSSAHALDSESLSKRLAAIKEISFYWAQHGMKDQALALIKAGVVEANTVDAPATKTLKMLIRDQGILEKMLKKTGAVTNTFVSQAVTEQPAAIAVVTPTPLPDLTIKPTIAQQLFYSAQFQGEVTSGSYSHTQSTTPQPWEGRTPSPQLVQLPLQEAANQFKAICGALGQAKLDTGGHVVVQSCKITSAEQISSALQIINETFRKTAGLTQYYSPTQTPGHIRVALAKFAENMPFKRPAFINMSGLWHDTQYKGLYAAPSPVQGYENSVLAGGNEPCKVVDKLKHCLADFAEKPKIAAVKLGDAFFDFAWNGKADSLGQSLFGFVSGNNDYAAEITSKMIVDARAPNSTESGAKAWVAQLCDTTTQAYESCKFDRSTMKDAMKAMLKRTQAYVLDEATKAYRPIAENLGSNPTLKPA